MMSDVAAYVLGSLAIVLATGIGLYTLHWQDKHR